MIFRISHKTVYHYQTPASESYGELRISPPSDHSQTVRKRKIEIKPKTPIRSYKDYFGNHVEFFSIPKRHDTLTVSSTAEVETLPQKMPDIAATLTVAETRQILQSKRLNHYLFLRPTPMVPLHQVLQPFKRDFIKRDQPLDQALLGLNHWIYKNMKYRSGSTTVSTPLQTVIKKRTGVCQDFAHLMLSILRTYGIPARYVSGYIEAYDPTVTDAKLIGATASHAWVEAYLPGEHWVGLDPTNDQVAGERHVRVAVGRDYRDVTPLKGTYKGASDQKLQVIVSVTRKKAKS